MRSGLWLKNWRGLQVADGKGRPTKYNSKFHPKLIALLAAQGLTDEQMAKELEITTATLYTWYNKHKDFLEAKKRGKEHPDDLVEAAVFKKATGYRYTEESTSRDGIVSLEKQAHADTTAAIFWLKNRRPEKWRDKQEIAHTINKEAIDELKDIYEEGYERQSD